MRSPRFWLLSGFLVKKLPRGSGLLQAGVRALGQLVVVYRDNNAAPMWSWHVYLSPEAREELLFWQENLVVLDGRYIRCNQVPV